MPVGCAGCSKILLQSNRPTTLLSLRIREFDIRILAHMLNSLVRVSRREKENHFVHPQLDHVTESLTVYSDTIMQVCCVVRVGWTTFTSKAWAWCKTSICKHTLAIHQRMHNTDSLRFLLSNFRYSLTLFSKFFSSFPHGTCALLVSLVYLALDGIYHPLWAAIPNNSTRYSCALQGTVQAKQTGVSPCILSHSKEFSFAYIWQLCCARGWLTTIHWWSSWLPLIHMPSFSWFSRPYYRNPG